MKYELHDKWDDYTFGGSALVGSVIITRDELVARFGEPIQVNGEYIKERWLLTFEDGTVATIFSSTRWRNRKENEWYVGGFGGYDKKTKENLSFRAVQNLLNS